MAILSLPAVPYIDHPLISPDDVRDGSALLRAQALRVQAMAEFLDSSTKLYWAVLPGLLHKADLDPDIAYFLDWSKQYPYAEDPHTGLVVTLAPKDIEYRLPTPYYVSVQDMAFFGPPPRKGSTPAHADYLLHYVQENDMSRTTATVPKIRAVINTARILSAN